MSPDPPKPAGLPFATPWPGLPRRRLAALARAAVYAAVIAAMIVPVVQFQAGLAKRIRQAEAYERRAAAGTLPPGVARPSGTKGAVIRWGRPIRRFWQGVNIYRTREEAAAEAARGDRPDDGRLPVGLHPNMPFTVMVLTPFAYLPPLTAALIYNVLKVAVIVASVLLAVAVANHDGGRMPDWVVAAALLFGLRLVVADVQHGNTNSFVLGGVVLHLWMYRRGHDFWAGVPLAAAICLKMTPAMFLLYWLYQRNGRLLAGALAALLVFAVLVPGAALGPSRYADYTGAWLENLVIPGLVKGSWYPTHINQSLPGVAARYLMDAREGDIYWDPEQDPAYTTERHGWINLVSMPDPAARWVVRALQTAVVALMAWAIGWRKLPRDDGRRGLHYAIVLLGMMILNQRTWDHHAAVLLPAYVAVWYAIAFGRLPGPGRVRAWALGLALAAGALVWAKAGELFRLAARLAGEPKGAGELWGNRFMAYGPMLLHFLLMLAACVLLARAMRKQADPYADRRQKLTE